MDSSHSKTVEHKRLLGSHSSKWRTWGPYVADRQWGTVREDYSANGDAWEYFPFEMSGRRVYRWSEDGIFGISDDHQHLCFALAMWNGADDRLKERFFGVTNKQGNHGEDVKEYYYHLDNVPSHAYMSALYKYPHAAFPYKDLLEENRRRTRVQPEYELVDTGIFKDNRYFDVLVEYAKNDPNDVLIRITVTNRGPDSHALHMLPTLWFRNEWRWRTGFEPLTIGAGDAIGTDAHAIAHHPHLGTYHLYARAPKRMLYTSNETNFQALWGVANHTPFTKDGIERYIVHGDEGAVDPQMQGSKVSAHYDLVLQPGESREMVLRLCDNHIEAPFDRHFGALFEKRMKEADEFYKAVTTASCDAEAARVQRTAFAGLLWSKQYYHYNVPTWLHGDPLQPKPPDARLQGRNHQWIHFDAAEVMSMPDKWEYPWFAAWDLAFHTVSLALIDPAFAKNQLLLLGREWFMRPNGQLPAYEWVFADVNPPVHAWAALRIYEIEKKNYGHGDTAFLERMFQKLLLTFTWWVNRKDPEGNDIFEGGFLGLDNIGLFDRSRPLPSGVHINQSDGTSWMAAFILNMLAISIELALHNPVYEDIATKFFEHFLFIADAMNNLNGTGLWNDEEGFYYDILMLDDGRKIPMKIRSMVGIIPMFAVQVIEPGELNALPTFRKHVEWFIKNRARFAKNVASVSEEGKGMRHCLTIVDRDKLTKLLGKVLQESEFLSDYGVRSLSRYHKDHPFMLKLDGHEYRVDYEPAESHVDAFGGNSNWRGPVWFPLNFLLLEALQRYHSYFGTGFKVECPMGSGNLVDLSQVCANISKRLLNIFLPTTDGKRPVNGGVELFQRDPNWKDHLLFYEYFNGDNGAGLGASHQTGWTALIANLIELQGETTPVRAAAE